MDRWRSSLVREAARTVRGALTSWPRTARLCLLMAVMTLPLVGVAFTVRLIRP